MLRKALQHATVVVAPVHELDDFGLKNWRQDRGDRHRERCRASLPCVTRALSPSSTGALPAWACAGRRCSTMIMAATDKRRGPAGDDYLEIITGLGLSRA